jgi:hypothetical protein
VGTIAVIWLGVFTAASKSIAAPVTDMIKGGLSTAGKWIGTLPFKHAPIFHIDLPGVEGDERYTGSQVWEAVRGLASEKKPGKLRDLLTKGKTVYPKDLADKDKIKTSAHVLSWLKNADEQNMTANDLKSGMLTLKKRGDDLYNNFIKEHPMLKEPINDVLNKKGKKLETAKNALLKHYRVRNFRAPATTTAAATTATVTNVTNKTTINGKNLTDIQVGQIKPTLSNLSKELEKKIPTKKTVDGYLRTIRDSLPAVTTAKGIKDVKDNVLGTSMVTHLRRMYTEAELDKAITG